MDKERRKDLLIDFVVLVVVVVIGQAVSEAVPIYDEMLKFLISAVVAGVLLVLFYVVRQWLSERD